jgi:hypothetical protein
MKMSSGRPRNSWARLASRRCERQRPQVVATERKDVEGVELSSERGARGEYHCPVCDAALEIFDGNHLPWAPNRER